jgi:hypothetical protein
MYSLTYDLWNAIIDEAADAYSNLFEAMQRAASNVRLSKSLVDELRLKGTIDIANDTRQFLLAIELYDDGIGGFKISLMTSESIDAFQEIKERAAAVYEVTPDDIRNFEVEHGLDMSDEILDMIEEKYSVNASEADENIVFELVVFDSEDIDNNSIMGNGAWEAIG